MSESGSYRCLICGKAITSFDETRANLNMIKHIRLSHPGEPYAVNMAKIPTSGDSTT